MFDWLKRLTKKPSKRPPAPPPPRQQSTPPAVTLRWLLGLSGRLSDGSNESIRFRENIESPRIRLGELQSWTAEALSGPPDEQHLFALQDIVNSLGTRLGFQVEYGSYLSRGASWMPFDGLWRLTEDLYLAIEVFSDPLERIDFAGLDRDLRSLARNPALSRAETVACFLLCNGASPEIWGEIRRSSLHDRVRLLPLGTLFDLLRMDNEGVLSRKQLPVLLRPFSPLGVNDVLGFLEEFIGAYQVAPPAEEGGEASGSFPVPEPREAAPMRGGSDLPAILQIQADGDLEGARKLLTSYLSSHPEDPRAWETAGDWALLGGDREAAIRAYRASLSREAGRTGAVVSLARLYRDQGDFATAVKVLDGAGGLDAPLPVLLERAELMLAIQSFDQAEQIAQMAHAASGGVPALVLLGRSRQARGDHVGAAAAFKMALDESPGDPEVSALLEASERELPREEG